MFAYHTEVGVLRGRFGYLRIAGGPRPLLVLPGMALAKSRPGRLVARAYGTAPHAAADPHPARRAAPPGLPAGTSTAALAAGYAALHDEFGAVDVLAFSTGGLIAQHLALDHPQAVMRLALVSTGARIGDGGRELCRDWLDRAAARDWRGLRRALAAVAVDGPVAQRLARALVRPRDASARDGRVRLRGDGVRGPAPRHHGPLAGRARAHAADRRQPRRPSSRSGVAGGGAGDERGAAARSTGAADTAWPSSGDGGCRPTSSPSSPIGNRPGSG
jgi:pimeloyl-ACP methyl ester carboxylesterase